MLLLCGGLYEGCMGQYGENKSPTIDHRAVGVQYLREVADVAPVRAVVRVAPPRLAVGQQRHVARFDAAHLGFDRIVASDKEVPNLLANLV